MCNNIEIRIFGVNDVGDNEELHRYVSVAVPRAGDLICIQYFHAEVYRIEWTIREKNMPLVHVFCDISEL